MNSNQWNIFMAIFLIIGIMYIVIGWWDIVIDFLALIGITFFLVAIAFGLSSYFEKK